MFLSMLIPLIDMFDKSHITSPIGAATTIALPRTYKVLSNIDLTITFPICGFLYGGSSNIKDDGIPFNIVFDNNLDTNKVAIMPSIINNTSNNEEVIVLVVKNIAIRVIKVGNLPLHGTKLFVNIAINLSLLESIILLPTTPQALQPNPIHIVSDCLPLDEHLLNKLSILNAILGKYPESSSNVNSGKI